MFGNNLENKISFLPASPTTPSYGGAVFKIAKAMSKLGVISFFWEDNDDPTKKKNAHPYMDAVRQ